MTIIRASLYVFMMTNASDEFYPSDEEQTLTQLLLSCFYHV